MYLLDLHVHYKTRKRSTDTFEEAQCQAAVDKGLHGIMFTEHEEQLTNERIAELNEQFAPLKIYSGVEVRVAGRDILVAHPDGWCPYFHEKMPDYHTFMKLARRIKAATILAHPFRGGGDIPSGFADNPTDGIELRSCNTPLIAEERIREAAAARNVWMFMNSDAHRARHVGAYYNVVEYLPKNHLELTKMISGTG